jgi:hypothetical protein
LLRFARFPPAQVKAVIDRVLEQELKGKVYDVEEAKEWSINICENIKSAVKGSARFSSTTVAIYPPDFIRVLSLLPFQTSAISLAIRLWFR